VISAIGRVAMVLDPWDKPICLERVWCAPASHASPESRPPRGLRRLALQVPRCRRSILRSDARPPFAPLASRAPSLRSPRFLRAPSPPMAPTLPTECQVPLRDCADGRRRAARARLEAQAALRLALLSERLQPKGHHVQGGAGG
jgi:hypothetical protein